MMLRQFLNPPNWFSSASLFCGLYAIFLAGNAAGDAGAFYQAGLMIFFAGLFDALDGRVARMTGTGSAFGVQLDSLIDIVSFGVAPAALVYFWGMSDLGSVGIFVAFFFMLCGAFRLARFNVEADGKAHAWSKGLTITMGGGTLASLVMWEAAQGRADALHPIALIAFTLTLAILMVSSVPFRSMKTLRRDFRTMAAVLVFAGGFIAMGVLYDISLVLVTLGVIYVASGPVEYAFGWPRRRRSRRTRAAAAHHAKKDDDGER